MTSDGLLYAKKRFEEICREKYLISKHTHTSYIECGLLTPAEKYNILKFLNEDFKAQANAIEEAKSNSLNNK